MPKIQIELTEDQVRTIRALAVVANELFPETDFQALAQLREGVSEALGFVERALAGQDCFRIANDELPDFLRVLNAPSLPLVEALERVGQIKLLGRSGEPPLIAAADRAGIVSASYDEILRMAARFHGRSKSGDNLGDRFYAEFCAKVAACLEAQAETLLREYLAEERIQADDAGKAVAA